MSEHCSAAVNVKVRPTCSGRKHENEIMLGALGVLPEQAGVARKRLAMRLGLTFFQAQAKPLKVYPVTRQSSWTSGDPTGPKTECESTEARTDAEQS